MFALDFIFWTFNLDDGKTERGKILPVFALGLFDAVKFTETMVTFTETMVKVIELATAALRTNIVTFRVDLLHS